MNQRLARAALAATLTLATLAGHAQPAAAPVDRAERSAVTESTLQELRKSYIFPQVAERMDADIHKREAAGEYEAATEPQEFARTLTGHLQAVSNDKHLRVFPGEAQGARRHKFAVPGRHGLGRAEVLAGNVGYLEVLSFMGRGDEAHEAVAEAMTKLAGTRALIIDVRANGGGSPAMVARLSSYLFERRTHLNSLYWREGDRTDEFWTLDDVAGTRFGESKPVFVLTSKRTFSGAEEFGYNLKNLKRATLVGERTGGGAHPGAVRRLNDRFSLFVPTGRAINPVTGTNWEGTGVVPDVEVPAEQALERALELAAGRAA